jgi:hypothetical protein
MKTIYAIAVVLLVLCACIILKRRAGTPGMAAPASAPAPLPEGDKMVTFDAAAIRVRYPDGEVRALAWEELGMVGIRTTDEGPFAPDVFWGLHARDGQPRLIYPGGAAGEGELLAEMQRRLAGFDNARLIEAMTSTGQAFFPIWMREGQEQAA